MGLPAMRETSSLSLYHAHYPFLMQHTLLFCLLFSLFLTQKSWAVISILFYQKGKDVEVTVHGSLRLSNPTPRGQINAFFAPYAELWLPGSSNTQLRSELVFGLNMVKQVSTFQELTTLRGRTHNLDRLFGVTEQQEQRGYYYFHDLSGENTPSSTALFMERDGNLYFDSFHWDDSSKTLNFTQDNRYLINGLNLQEKKLQGIHHLKLWSSLDTGDFIQLTTVPEPSTSMILWLSGATLLFCRRRFSHLSHSI